MKLQTDQNLINMPQTSQTANLEIFDIVLGNPPKKYPNYAFIDGQNIETGLRLQGFRVDFKLLFEYLTTVYNTQKVYFCTKHSNQAHRLEFFESLKSIGFEIIFSSGMGNGKGDGSHKVNVDADLIVRAMKDYFMDKKFGLILLSGDGDFVPLIRFFEESKQFVKIITASKISASKMLSFDRFTKKKRKLSYMHEELQKLTQKISPPRESGGIEDI